MSISTESSTFTGTVTNLDVGGNGPNSAQLEFSVTPLKGTGEPATFAVEFDTEPQVFSGMATLLTAAYMAKLTISITYLSQAGATLKATRIKVGAPAARATGRIGFV